MGKVDHLTCLSKKMVLYVQLVDTECINITFISVLCVFLTNVLSICYCHFIMTFLLRSDFTFVLSYAWAFSTRPFTVNGLSLVDCHIFRLLWSSWPGCWRHTFLNWLILIICALDPSCWFKQRSEDCDIHILSSVLAYLHYSWLWFVFIIF